MQRKQGRTKEATSMRLSHDAKHLLSLLSNHLGLSQAGVVELLIRERARREKVTLKESEG